MPAGATGQLGRKRNPRHLLTPKYNRITKVQREAKGGKQASAGSVETETEMEATDTVTTL